MLRIKYRSEARKFARKLPAKQQNQISARIVALSHEPRPHDSRRLKGNLSAYRRVDVGEYRIIYLIESDALFIGEIGKRNDEEAYRRMQRRLA